MRLAFLAGLGRGALPWLAAGSALTIAAGAGLDASGRAASLCGRFDAAGVVSSTRALLGTFPPGQLAIAWATMVVATMPPLVSAPINHVWTSVLPRRRARSVALTLGAYLAVWMAAGIALLPLAVALATVADGTALPAALVLAFGWSCSPVSQRALNRCHRNVRLGLRGPRADLDCLRQGLAVAPACVLACWPWMVACVAAGSWHMEAMLGAVVFLVLDRLAPASSVRWRLPPALAFARAAVRGARPRSAVRPMTRTA